MEATNNTVLVHKQDAEGSISIDRYTGQIVTPHDERPDWAAELTIAQIAMRDVFYINALGPLYTEERRNPEVFAFEDIDWLGAREYADGQTDAEGLDHELFNVEADHEFRQSQVATALGIEAELDEHGNETGNIAGALASVEVSSDNMRTPEELAELEAEQRAGAKAVGE